MNLVVGGDLRVKCCKRCLHFSTLLLAAGKLFFSYKRYIYVCLSVSWLLASYNVFLIVSSRFPFFS